MYIKNMGFHLLHRLVYLLCICALAGWANDSMKTDIQLDSTKNHALGDISIFGDNAIGSIFILWDNIDISTDIKKNIQEKSFATDPFFMQNIDREEFEQERLLQLFSDDKKQYFKLFPDAVSDDEDDE